MTDRKEWLRLEWLRAAARYTRERAPQVRAAAAAAAHERDALARADKRLRFWVAARLDRMSPQRLLALRQRVLRRRHHPQQLPAPLFDLALAEFDAYCTRRGVCSTPRA